MDKSYNTSTLFLKCGEATVDQIREAFKAALSTHELGSYIKFKINRVEDKFGNPFGIAFVWLLSTRLPSDSEAVYYMLLGKNPDGSPRIDYIDDPSWVSPEGSGVTNTSWESIGDNKIDWADMADEDDLNQKFICPKIPVCLEPLMSLPPYKLTQKQRASKREAMIEINQETEGFNPDLLEIPEYAYITVNRTKVVPVESNLMPNILKCKAVPTWLDKNDIKREFMPFASDNKTIHSRLIRGQYVEEAYPWVNVNDGIAFIIFDPSTNDAQFALHMMRKAVFTKRTREGAENKVTLIFSHSYRTDRDLMAEISQKTKQTKGIKPHEIKPIAQDSKHKSQQKPKK